MRDHARLLKECRDQIDHKLRLAIRTLLDELAKHLLAKGESADERAQRNSCFEGSDTLRERASRIESLVGSRWLRAFDDACGHHHVRPTLEAIADSDALQLVDLVAMDEEIAVKSLVSALRDKCEESVFAAGRRLAYLLDREEPPFPLGDVMIGAMDSALKDADLSVSLRLEVLHGLEQRLLTSLAPVIDDLNAFLVSRRVLPKLRRSYARSRAEKAASADAALGGTATVAGGSGAAAASDVFALLQRLAGVPAGAVVPTVPSVGAAAGWPGGTPNQEPGVVLPASMAVAMQQTMASLDVLQHAALPIMTTAPSTGVLREFRASTVGQGLDHLDAITVDIVATLFDFIFDDAAIADPIKALVARLQIPVLKVAMLDKSFFSSKSHPARRLLDGISRAAVRCGRDMNHDDPLYGRLVAIVERVQAEFAQDTSLFDVLCVELDEFLAGQEADADAHAVRAAPLVAQREQRELAAVAADQTLASWLTMPLPAGVADLLTHEWRMLLVRRYLQGEEAAWNQAVAMIGELVTSVGPQPDNPGRKQLAARLPTLVKQVVDGLNEVGVPAERRTILIDNLFSIHAAVLRGAAPVVTTPLPASTAVEASIVTESVAVEGGELQSISLVDADQVPLPEDDDSEAQLQVDDLHRGDWVEFAGSGESGPVRYRLSWISPERGILLFTNPQSPRALSIAPAALALQIERGEASIVPVEAIFDRAVYRALETLKAA